MSFVSFEFLGFFAAAALLYFLLPLKWRRFGLLAAGYAFYAICDWRGLAFIVITTVSSFYAAQRFGDVNAECEAELAAHPEWKRVDKKECKQRHTARKNWLLSAVLALNFGLLGLFKYANFLIENLNLLLDWLLPLLRGLVGAGAPLPVNGAVANGVIPTLRLLLPLGISFYTFQAAGYVLDVYHNKYAPDRSLWQYALFLCWFPQLVQGPIARHSQLAHQLAEPHRFDFVRCRHALQLMLWGYFKKCVIADRLAIPVTALFNNYDSYGGAMLFLAALLYGLQIYADFSGGIDIARGVSRYFGIELAENFRRPYFSASVSEFWRRWHITLGAWMKDHIFYPLALSERMTRFSRRLAKGGRPWLSKMLPTCLCSLAVFLLVGLWHGAEWRYVLYGLWNGGLIALSTLAAPLYRRQNKLLHLNEQGAFLRLFRVLRTLLLVSMGRFLVRSSDVQQAWAMFIRLFRDPRLAELFGGGRLLELGLNGKQWIVLVIALAVLLAVGILQERGHHLSDELEQRPVAIQLAVELAVLLFILVFGCYGPEYNAADFIYMQF